MRCAVAQKRGDLDEINVHIGTTLDVVSGGSTSHQTLPSERQCLCLKKQFLNVSFCRKLFCYCNIPTVTLTSWRMRLSARRSATSWRMRLSERYSYFIWVLVLMASEIMQLFNSGQPHQNRSPPLALPLRRPTSSKKWELVFEFQFWMLMRICCFLYLCLMLCCYFLNFDFSYHGFLRPFMESLLLVIYLTTSKLQTSNFKSSVVHSRVSAHCGSCAAWL